MGLSKSQLEYSWQLYSSQLNDDLKHALLKPSGRNNELKKSDYIAALSKITTYKRHGYDLTRDLTARELWNALTRAERYRLSFYTPCLARPIDDLNDKQRNTIFNSPDWIFTEKHRGIRCTLIVDDGLFYLYSRNYDDDCGLINYSKKILQNVLFEGIYAIDVEMMINDNISIAKELFRYNVQADTRPEQILGLMQLEPNIALAIQKRVKQEYGIDLIQFKMIAPLYYNGTDYLKRTLGEGMGVYDDALRLGKSIGLNITSLRRLNASDEYSKEIFLKTLLENGSDGVVAQNKNGLYNTNDTRSKESYIKIKHIGGQMGDTFDCFVSSVSDKMTLSLFIDNNGRQNECVVAIMKIPRSKRDKIFNDTVIELSASGIDKRRRLIAPKIVKMRPDKNKYECVYTNEFIDAQIERSAY